MEDTQQIRYECLLCGSFITDPAINHPCPGCGWRGSKPPSEQLLKRFHEVE